MHRLFVMASPFKASASTRCIGTYRNTSAVQLPVLDTDPKGPFKGLSFGPLTVRPFFGFVNFRIWGFPIIGDPTNVVP